MPRRIDIIYPSLYHSVSNRRFGDAMRHHSLFPFHHENRWWFVFGDTFVLFHPSHVLAAMVRFFYTILFSAKFFFFYQLFFLVSLAVCLCQWIRVVGYGNSDSDANQPMATIKSTFNANMYFPCFSSCFFSLFNRNLLYFFLVRNKSQKMVIRWWGEEILSLTEHTHSVLISWQIGQLGSFDWGSVCLKYLLKWGFLRLTAKKIDRLKCNFEEIGEEHSFLFHSFHIVPLGNVIRKYNTNNPDFHF